ncbi:hypothetical protein [Tolypothrix sp. NIES-4075]|nr:hypothetical protein [Tolypothrix sp. NIES-4075]
MNSCRGFVNLGLSKMADTTVMGESGKYTNDLSEWHNAQSTLC